MRLDVDYATTLVAAVLLGVGFVLQQYAAQNEPESRFLSLRLITDLLRKPRWLAGIVCMVAGQLLAAWSIGSLELTLVEPLLTTYLLFALLLAVPLSKQSMRWPEAGGALVLIAGVTLLSLSRSTKPIGLSIGSFSHWPAAAVIAGLAFVAVQVGQTRRGPARATLTGLAAGLVFGIQDALTRQTLEILQAHSVSALLTAWPPYCLLATGIVGLWLMQNAFSAGPLHSSLPTIAAGEPVAGIILGIVVFGDRIQITPGMLAIEAGGIAALIVGVVLVARSSAFGRLHTITDVIKPHHTEAPGAGQHRSPAARRPPVVHHRRAQNGDTPPDALAPDGLAPDAWPRTAWPRTAWPRTAWPRTAWPRTAWPRTAWPRTAWPRTAWPPRTAVPRPRACRSPAASLPGTPGLRPAACLPGTTRLRRMGCLLWRGPLPAAYRARGRPVCQPPRFPVVPGYTADPPVWRTCGRTYPNRPKARCRSPPRRFTGACSMAPPPAPSTAEQPGQVPRATPARCPDLCGARRRACCVSPRPRGCGCSARGGAALRPLRGLPHRSIRGVADIEPDRGQGLPDRVGGREIALAAKPGS